MRILVGAGGNLGTSADIVGRFQAASTALEKRLSATRAMWSGLYVSAPVGPVIDQPRFLNAVLSLDLYEPVFPVQVLACLLAVEVEFGRIRQDTVPKGPRTIDLDLLFADEHVLQSHGPPVLRLPHPHIAERAFVLHPLADLMGATWYMPGIGRTVTECLADPRVARQRIMRRPWRHPSHGMDPQRAVFLE